MVRWLLVGALFLGLGAGFRNGWITVNWVKMTQDLGVPFLADPDPIRSFTEAQDAPAEERRQAR